METSIPVVDHRGAMDRLDGDEELWNEIREIWVEDAPQMLRNVQEALAELNADGLRRAAHALKGASSNVGAARVTEAAREIETKAMAGDWKALGDGVSQLDEEVHRALEALASSGS